MGNHRIGNLRPNQLLLIVYKGGFFMKLPRRIELVEVGLRDGIQNESVQLSVKQKLELISDIIDAGFKIVEIGSFVRPDIVPQMANTIELFKQLDKVDGIEYRALIPNMRGLENAINCGCTSVKIGVSASRVHNLANYNRTPEQSISAFEKVFSTAFEHNIDIIGTIQMAFGSPWDDEIPFEDILSIVKTYKSLGAKKIGISDTASMASPKQVYYTCSKLIEQFPDIRFKLHFHNARGLALPNILAGAAAGVTEFDSAFAGLGGCPFIPNAAGNVATEDVVNMFNELGIETGIEIEKVIQIGYKIESLVGHKGTSHILRAGTSENLKCSIKSRNKETT
jgi:hydroxymethylglutaryl-CoA lyase